MAAYSNDNGSGPFEYLLIIKGKIICNGVNGTAKRPSFSRGTPYSISLSTVIDSVANAIYIKKMSIFAKILFFLSFKRLLLSW